MVHSFSAPSGVDEEVTNGLLHWSMTTELFTEFWDSVVHIELPVPSTPTMAVARYRFTPPSWYPLRFYVTGSAGNVSADAYSHGYIEVADGDPVPLPPGGRTVYTAHNDEAERMVTGEIWVKVYGRKQVRIQLSRDTVLPVFADLFNARTQGVMNRYSVLAARPDSVRVTLRGVTTDTAKAKRTVWLVSDPVEGSGGHVHNQSTERRPAGTFFTLDSLSRLVDSTAGKRDSLRIVLPIGHDTTVVYRPSGIGGSEWILVHPTVNGTTARDSVELVIRLSGLVLIPASTGGYSLGPSDNHGANDRYLWPGTIEALDSVLSKWVDRHNKPTKAARYPLSPGGFTLDATSLPGGGMLDITGRWSARGHELHREGLDADFNNLAVENATNWVDGVSPRRRLQRLCERQWFQLAEGRRYRLDCQAHANPKGGGIHFHVMLVPQRARDIALPWRR